MAVDQPSGADRHVQRVRIQIHEVDPDGAVIREIVNTVLPAPVAAALLVETGVDLEVGATES